LRPGIRPAPLGREVREGRVGRVWAEPPRREDETLLRRIPPISWRDLSDLFRDEDRFPGSVDQRGFESVPAPDDRKFASLAAAAGATLVSLDAHLLEAGLGDRPRGVRP